MLVHKLVPQILHRISGAFSTTIFQAELLILLPITYNASAATGQLEVQELVVQLPQTFDPPDSIRFSNSLSSFKQNLKTSFFVGLISDSALNDILIYRIATCNKVKCLCKKHLVMHPKDD